MTNIQLLKEVLKNMKKRILILLALITASSVYAANSVYVDANAGLNTSYADGLGLNLNVGYLFNSYLGVEGGVTYGASNINWNGGNNYYMYDAAVKGVLPLSDVFALYGKLGVGYNTYSSCSGCINGYQYTGSNIGMLYGAGAQFNLSKQWSLHVEDYTVTGNNPNMLMFGAEFKF